MSESKINSLVDNVYVLNLEKDSFKYDILKRKLDKKNIQHQRFLGVDGYDGLISTEEKEKAFKNMIDKYRGTDLYEPLLRRGGYVLWNRACGANRTRGAMGCLLSHRKIIQDAIDNKYKKILLLQDDIYFHNKFDQVLSDLTPTIESSLMVHLGAAEHSSHIQRDKWPNPSWNYRRVRYSTTAETCGLWGTIIDQEMFGPFMELSQFKFFAADISFAVLGVYKYPHDTWVAHPNIIIAERSHSNTSETDEYTVPMGRGFGWDLSAYDLSERYYE
ncbi:hypothetical protein CL634_04895 [bacterium]|nr:hypothetical protein [bacterium]|tara:strand:+ start:605 stop:1426 length:822 start_codon:yes stop_codon:yes gene_type:complete